MAWIAGAFACDLLGHWLGRSVPRWIQTLATQRGRARL